MVKKILIVDDDAQFVFVLQRSLVKRNYEVFAAENGAQACDVLQQESVDAAIVDLKLAHESGLKLIAQMKNIAPNLQILMLTGYASIATAVEAIKQGAQNYLAKPANTDEILSALALTINQSASQDLPADLLDESVVSVNRVEWEHIQKILQAHQGNVSATARALGMHRRTLQRKLQKRPY